MSADISTAVTPASAPVPERSAADVHADLAAAIKDFEAKTAAADTANAAAGAAARLIQKLRAEVAGLEGDATSILYRAESFIRKHL